MRVKPELDARREFHAGFRGNIRRVDIEDLLCDTALATHPLWVLRDSDVAAWRDAHPGALARWREESRREIVARGEAFARMLATVPGWRIDSSGAYFAYVRHPFAGVPAARVAEKLARERGVLCLPGSYFGPGQDTHLRIAIANAARGTIASLAPRFAP
ncbi:MAG: hypothetical protein EBR51_09560 [Gammaproteobacteria bacterium]|nr:hypothetical protein [Gammaproteobacteria bacterium]